jgi:thiamine-monophosphate kinase
VRTLSRKNPFPRAGDILEEEGVIEELWKRIRSSGNGDPFSDDAAWVRNLPRSKYLVAKCDMFVSSTDAPPQMSPRQFAMKAVTSCVSDFAAKGVSPQYALVSIALPKTASDSKTVREIALGFKWSEKTYGIQILGGDTNESTKGIVIDVCLFGFSNAIVTRGGAKQGDFVAVSGNFGLQPLGLKLLLSNGSSFALKNSIERKAAKSVLEPRARIDAGLRYHRFMTSCIDSSDGLALSLYHLAESSNVSIELYSLPISNGLEDYAMAHKVNPSELVLFGGEEYELVCTFHPDHETKMRRGGFRIIGRVIQQSNSRNQKAAVYFRGEEVPRKGWQHLSK